MDANLPYADELHPNSSEIETGTRESILVNRQNRSGGPVTDESVGSKSAAETEYNRILSEINEKHREEEEINAILQDWKLLAQKVDYILFWVFLALTTVSSCIFIFILPYYKRGKLL